MARVSICIPAYKPDFFEFALRSALAQSFTDTEIIVSDDCPTEAIAEICAHYQPFVAYSRNPKPGEFTNVVRLAHLAKGEYIKYLFDDDVLDPFCVQFLWEAMEQTRPYGTMMAFSPRHTIDEGNHITSLVNHFQLTNELKVIGGRDFIRLTALNLVNLIGEFSTVLFRRADCFDDAGEFRLFRVAADGSFRGILDLSSWLDLARRGSFVAYPRPLSYFRQHANSTSNHEINPLFINGILYYQEIMETAQHEGYLLPGDEQPALTRLINHFTYWQQAYPELTLQIQALMLRLQQMTARP